MEISVSREAMWLPNHGEQIAEPGCDVVWRVKVIRLGESELIVEAPAAFGETVVLKPGIDLIGAMTIGQNRWMFHTRTLADRPKLTTRPGGPSLLSLAMPTNVERCTRRHFYRISTANLNLPDVQCWSLLDPSSVVAAEAANRASILDQFERRMRLGGGNAGQSAETAPDSIVLPDVGSMFTAKLVNISGGGLGIRVNQCDSAAAQHKPYLWMRVDLRPQIAAPLAVTVRTAHTHLDSTQHLYLGLAFDFAFNPEHRVFVVDQFQQYIDRLQSTQRSGQRAG